MQVTRTSSAVPILAVWIALAVTPGLAFAQAAEPGLASSPATQAAARPPDHPDFFFATPRFTLSARGSRLFARAGSDLYDFVTSQLTLDKGDFDAPAFDLDLGILITRRVEAVFGVSASKASHQSEYRDFVDNALLPIEQATALTSRSVTGSVRVALSPRGHSVSRFAWVPRRVTPYLGAGGGIVWYTFAQQGDFVDFVDLSVFRSQFRSNGWAPSAHVFAGADVHVYRRLYLSVEGRYQWASAELGQDFVDFDPIDLTGFRLGTGITLIF